MFKKCNVYYCMGFYFNEEEVKMLNIQSAKLLDIICIIENSSSVCKFDNGYQEIDKQEFIQSIMNIDNKDQKFCYRNIDGCFILFPFEIFYAISTRDDKLLAYYSDEKIRDAKLNLMYRDGISVVFEDMNKDSFKIKVFNDQYQLRKTYKSLTMNVE